MNNQNKVSVVIPTLNASGRIVRIIEALQDQTIPPSEILIVDSSSDDGTTDLLNGIKGIRVKIIDRESFNHGTTRHEALLDTSEDYICFLTDDAIPANKYLIEELLKPLADPFVAMVSGRQLPKEDARRFEQLVRKFNYPDKSNIRTKEDIEKLGIKAFFASDACSIYRRSAYLDVGGFIPVNTNEDMYMAACLLRKGYKVAYASSAQVLHSHNFSPMQQYKRYRDIGYFIETHRKLLGGARVSIEGMSLVKNVSMRLLKEMQFAELMLFGVDCVARYLGNRAGTKLARLEHPEGLG